VNPNSNPAVACARAAVAALGQAWNGKVNATTTALYTELQRLADRAGLSQYRDLSYGRHEQQVLDLVVPGDGPGNLPVVVYLHGGGFIRGDKLSPESDDLIYANVAAFFARNAMIGVNANYRLAPAAAWPAGAEDVALILKWLRAHIAHYGGDPSQVFLFGNSAGAAHAASYLFTEALHDSGAAGVRGALLSSGTFAATGEEGDIAYYGADLAKHAERSPLGLLERYEGEQLPMYMWSAQFDPPFIAAAVSRMHAQLCEKFSERPRFEQFQGHNHVSHVMSLDSADDEVGNAILAFIAEVQSRAGTPDS